jgi:hypothetical protein
MKVKVQETGKIENLEIHDPKTGVNWINDLMGNSGELPEYDYDDDVYLMDKESFDWWKNLTTELEAAEDRYFSLRQESDDPCGLDDDKNEFVGNCDLEDLPGYLNQFCDQIEAADDDDDD